jgi:P-type conjugative transfer protein TrbJ
LFSTSHFHASGITGAGFCRPAARTLQQINNQISQLQNEAVMLQNMAKNLQNLDYSSLGQMTSTLTRIGGLMTQAEGLSFNLSQLESQWEQQYPDSYAATVTTNDQAVAAQQRWQNVMGAYRQTMQVQSQIVANVQDDQPILAELVNRSQSAGGALQAQQAANQLAALSAKQQMQIQEMMAAQYRAQAEDAARKAQSEVAARETTQVFLGSGTAYSE